MFDMQSRGYARHRAAYGGGADLREMERAIGAGEGTVMQSAETQPVGDLSAKNWLIGALILFLFMYTVSRILD